MPALAVAQGWWPNQREGEREKGRKRERKHEKETENEKGKVVTRWWLGGGWQLARRGRSFRERERGEMGGRGSHVRFMDLKISDRNNSVAISVAVLNNLS